MDIRPETHVADLARELPATVKVFQRHRIDFCCGGRRPLAEVCSEQGLEIAGLIEELEAAGRGVGDSGGWGDAALRELTHHIVERYHRSLRQDLPLLGELATKVAGRHGDRHPELQEIERLFFELRDEMFLHMQKEEQVLFPLIERLESAEGGWPEGFPMMSLDGPIGAMEDDHEQVARILGRLRALSSGFQPPADACNSFRGLFRGLADLESDTHHHIHLENNILFPRAQGLVASASG
jgi:regulator of cell morphogenesis and NO signaling